MSDPGSADLSADVDFAFLKQAITKGSSKTKTKKKTKQKK
jgi:SAM-dependent MidA family methyltransferase